MGSNSRENCILSPIISEKMSSKVSTSDKKGGKKGRGLIEQTSTLTKVASKCSEKFLSKVVADRDQELYTKSDFFLFPLGSGMWALPWLAAPFPVFPSYESESQRI